VLYRRLVEEIRRQVKCLCYHGTIEYPRSGSVLDRWMLSKITGRRC